MSNIIIKILVTPLHQTPMFSVESTPVFYHNNRIFTLHSISYKLIYSLILTSYTRSRYHLKGCRCNRGLSAQNKKKLTDIKIKEMSTYNSKTAIFILASRTLHPSLLAFGSYYFIQSFSPSYKERAVTSVAPLSLEAPREKGFLLMD